jgi:hypothetical protein
MWLHVQGLAHHRIALNREPKAGGATKWPPRCGATAVKGFVLLMWFLTRASFVPVVRQDLALTIHTRSYHERDGGRKLCVSTTHHHAELQKT